MSRLQTPFPVGTIREAPVHLVRAGSGKVVPFGRNASSNAERGAALLSACDVLASGDQLVVGPGTFSLGTGVVYMPDGVAMIGSGRGITIIESNAILSTHGVIVQPGSGCYVADFSIVGLLDDNYQGCIGTHGANGRTVVNTRIERIDGTADTDGLYLRADNGGAIDVVLRDCQFQTKWDAVFMTHHSDGLATLLRLELDGCKLYTTGGSSQEPNYSRAVYLGGDEGGPCILLMRNSTAIADIDNEEGEAIALNPAGTTANDITLLNCRLSSSNPQGSNSDIAGFGTVRVSADTVYEASKAFVSPSGVSRLPTYGTTPTAAGLALLDDADAAAQRTTLGLASGTYTPSATAVANVDSATPGLAKYLRVGNIVHVSGSIVVDTTAGAPTVTRLRLSLPIASALTNSNQLDGVLCADSSVNWSGFVLGDAANDAAELYWNVYTSNAQTYRYTFSYQVI
jgi:hypothetical protein